MASDVRVTPVGTDIDYWQPSGGWQIKGIRVDNPSGSWLSVAPFNRSIPPYTLNWYTSYNASVANVSVKFVDGPVGKLSTLVGNPVTVTIYNTEVGSSDGVPFIGTTKPDVLIANINGLTANIVPTIYPLIVAPGLTSRLRLFSFSLAYKMSAPDIGNVPIQALVGITPPAYGIVYGLLSVSTPIRMSDVITLPDQGVDMPLNTALDAVVWTPWNPTEILGNKVPFFMHAEYAII